MCRPRKAIYGLHQAPRAFYKHIAGVLLRAGYQSIHGDPSIFTRLNNGNRSFIGLYVDDAMIASTSPEHLAETKAFLMRHFKMTWTETPKMLLGIEIQRDREAGRLRISQRHYANEILKMFNMEGCTPRKYPMLKVLLAHPQAIKPSPDRRFPYLGFIGKLNYLARSTPRSVIHRVAFGDLLQFLPGGTLQCMPRGYAIHKGNSERVYCVFARFSFTATRLQRRRLRYQSGRP
jgi:hypothetical protein